MNNNFFVRILSAVFLLSFLIVSSASAQTPQINYMNNTTLSQYSEISMPVTTSEAVVVYNAETMLSVHEKNSDKKVFPASSVKIMTAIIAYENIPDLSAEIKITKSVVNESVGTKLGLKKDDVYKAEDLIRAVLICGSNDAANQLADFVSGGKKSEFIKLMNEKAKELGCTATNFTNVTGLHDDNMYTTASDMLKIAIYAYGIEDISNWSSMASYSFAPVNDPDNYRLKYNRNNFVSRSATTKYYYPGAYGLSSGSTPQAGNCLITAATKNETTYICVLMQCPIIEKDDTNYAYVDARNLLNTCYSSLAFKNVLDTESIIHEVPLKLCADADHVSLYPSDEVKFLLPVDMVEYDDISYEKIVYNESYAAPIVAGDEFGELVVRYKGDYIIGKTKLICNTSYNRSSVLYIVDGIKKFITSSFFIVTLIAAVILFVLYTYMSARRRIRFFSRRR